MSDKVNVVGEAINALAEQIFQIRQDRSPIARAEIAIALAPLTFMIDKGQITVEEAAQRIELRHSALHPDPEHQLATVLIQTAVDFLRQNGPKGPGEARRWTPVVHQGGRQDDPKGEGDPA